MELNFDAVVRLTEALLPLLRALGAERDRQRRQHRRPRRAPGLRRLLGQQVRARRLDATRCASRSARTASTSASCCPGFVATEGFPQRELVDSAVTRWLVSTPDRAPRRSWTPAPGGAAERYVPRYYWIAAWGRVSLPGVVRRILGGSGGRKMRTTTRSR